MRPRFICVNTIQRMTTAMTIRTAIPLSPRNARKTDGAAWLSALHLASPTLPVGGFSYSEGLAAACAAGLAHDEASAGEWIVAALESVFERAEAPAWLLFYRAWKESQWDAVRHWNDWCLCTRESRELRLQTEQMGWSMVRLIEALELGETAARRELCALQPVCYAAASSFAFAAQDVAETEGLLAYAFSWLENQVAAAIKTIPLGQVAGQRLLVRLMRALPERVARAQARATGAPETLETFAPQFAILSARHESQYSRLFRS
jgi:urease accessory protein